jgi:hypothetical protein
MLDLGKKWEILQELLPTLVVVDLADSISCLDSVPIHRANPSLSAKLLRIQLFTGQLLTNKISLYTSPSDYKELSGKVSLSSQFPHFHRASEL